MQARMVSMCPNHQIISLYLDGELPSPWKEKMQSHLSGCPECQAAFARYKSLGDAMEAVPAETIRASQDRVWKKLTAPQLIVSNNAIHRNQEGFKPKKRVWSRKISLPLPVAAAAAIVIIFAFVALAGIRGTKPLQNVMATASLGGMGLDNYGTVPMQDMNGLIQYFSSQDNGDIMVIRLPESRKFSRAGEPALINAADYSRARRNISR